MALLRSADFKPGKEDLMEDALTPFLMEMTLVMFRRFMVVNIGNVEAATIAVVATGLIGSVGNIVARPNPSFPLTPVAMSWPAQKLWGSSLATTAPPMAEAMPQLLAVLGWHLKSTPMSAPLQQGECK